MNTLHILVCFYKFEGFLIKKDENLQEKFYHLNFQSKIIQKLFKELKTSMSNKSINKNPPTARPQRHKSSHSTDLSKKYYKVYPATIHDIS